MAIDIQLSSEFDEFLSDLLHSGKFASVDDVVTHALREFRNREEKLADLRELIQAGIDQLDRGEGIRIDSEQKWNEFFEGIRARGREILQERSTSQG